MQDHILAHYDRKTITKVASSSFCMRIIEHLGMNSVQKYFT